MIIEYRLAGNAGGEGYRPDSAYRIEIGRLTNGGGPENCGGAEHWPYVRVHVSFPEDRMDLARHFVGDLALLIVKYCEEHGLEPGEKWRARVGGAVYVPQDGGLYYRMFHKMTKEDFCEKNWCSYLFDVGEASGKMCLLYDVHSGWPCHIEDGRIVSCDKMQSRSYEAIEYFNTPGCTCRPIPGLYNMVIVGGQDDCPVHGFGDC